MSPLKKNMFKATFTKNIVNSKYNRQHANSLNQSTIYPKKLDDGPTIELEQVNNLVVSQGYKRIIPLTEFKQNKLFHYKKSKTPIN